MKAIETITGRVSVLMRDDIDTDQIIPKQFLKRVERTGFGEFLFYDWAKEPDWDLPVNQVLVAGRNFGCGSSREHAPWALEDYGFRAIIAPSFADIFKSNCTKVGLLPVQLTAEEVAAIAEAGECQVDLASQEVRWPGGTAHFDIDQNIKHRLLNGLDDIGETLQQGAAIDAFEADREQPSKPVRPRWSHEHARTLGRGDVRPRLAPQVSWSEAILDRLELRGDELVLDAGCGSGRVTELLLQRLPQGRVIALDADADMVRATRERFAADPRVEVVHQSLSEMELAGARRRGLLRRDVPLGPRSRRAASRASAGRLKPGGRISAQCGGRGQHRERRRGSPTACTRASRRTPGSTPAPRRPASAWSATASPTSQTWLQPMPVTPPEPLTFLGDVILGPYVQRLPEAERDAVRTARAGRARRPAGPRLRPPEHDRKEARLMPPRRRPARRRDRPGDHRPRGRDPPAARSGRHDRGAPVRRRLDRRARHGAHRRGRSPPARRPTPCCWRRRRPEVGHDRSRRAAPRAGAARPAQGARACSRTCARSARSRRSTTPARSSARSSRAPTCSSSAS